MYKRIGEVVKKIYHKREGKICIKITEAVKKMYQKREENIYMRISEAVKKMYHKLIYMNIYLRYSLSILS